MDNIDLLYSEIEAARMLRIKPRTLRSERVAGRISYRQVASKIMYCVGDLKAWQERICREADPTKVQSSYQSRRRAGKNQSGISDGAKAAGTESIQQAQEIAN